MNNKEKNIAVLKALEYLIAEGLAVEDNGFYRIKTDKENEDELNYLLNEKE